MTETVLRFREARAGEHGLFPADERGHEVFAALKLNRDTWSNVEQECNMRQFRLYWAIVGFVKKHCELFAAVPDETVEDAIKIGVGHTRKAIDQETGRVHWVLKSISPRKIGRVKFNEFFDAAVELIVQRWMPPGTTADSVRAELVAMVDGPYANDERRRA